MTRKFFAALVVLLVVVAAPLRADLKYTTHTEIKASTVPAGPAQSPLITMLAAQFAKQMLPNGSADTVYIISERGVRTEYVKGGMNMETEGTVTLLFPNGDFVHLNPAEKTYWKTTAAAMKTMLESTGMVPQLTPKPTNETATIAGVQAKRTDVDIKVPLPIPQELRPQLPPDLPSELTLSAENWMATAPFEKYLPLVAKIADVMGPGAGLARTAAPGILVRQVLRGMIFGAQQMESVVTQIGEQAPVAGAFDIPADYKEVPSPFGIK